MAYYENAGMLREQSTRWLDLPPDILRNLQIIVVDDGSPSNAAAHALHGGVIAWLRVESAGFQVWRMGVDVRWNQDACRNIGVREASSQWVLLTDMDHVVPVDTWFALMTARLKKYTAFRFRRVNWPDLDPYKPHPNSWAMPRKLYWKIGGYDEALAGNYGTDGDFLVRTRRIADVEELPYPLIRYSRDVLADASTTTLERKRDIDKANVIRICKAREANPQWKPLQFSFPCERVL
jgi:glycosyltransferase involved in cell wall biosynthesis